MIKKKFTFYFLLMIFFISTNNIMGQEETIGLRYYNDNVSEGYTLFSPKKNNSTYLINNCGEVINEWTFSEKPGATCYLLEDGRLLRAGKDSLEIRDWESNLMWSFSTDANGINQHHDIEYLPNGNILCVVGVTYTKEDIVALGRDPENTSDSFRMDKIIELQPTGTQGAEIVWEWNFIDHLVQEFDPSKPNYGAVIDHPELIDINYINSNNSDFTHVNAVDYNADLDQIIISPRHLNEILIIDHSTSTAEAAGHSGGNSGIGGDIMWRWGNPAGYQQGSEEDQKLFLQHDSKWVENGYFDEGKISVFNNGGDLTDKFSSVHLLTPTFSDGVYQKEGGKFLPNDYNWTWNGTILGDTMQEPSQSGAISLQNGNFMVCETSKGQFFEVTKSGEILLTYVNPTGSEIYEQFTIIENKDNAIFRAEKYPLDYPGFDNKNMSPIGIIENENSISSMCMNIQGSEELNKTLVQILNPVVDNNIHFINHISNTNITISDINGRILFTKDNFSGNTLNTNLKPSIYLLQLQNGNNKQVIKIIVQ